MTKNTLFSVIVIAVLGTAAFGVHLQDQENYRKAHFLDANGNIDHHAVCVAQQYKKCVDRDMLTNAACLQVAQEEYCSDKQAAPAPMDTSRIAGH